MKWPLTVLILMMCTSCSALPAEERAFAVVVSVEKSEGLWRVLARIPTYQTGGGYHTVTGEGSSLNAALVDMDAPAPMHLHLSQLRLIVLHADIGVEIPSVLQTLSERMDVRQSCTVVMTNASVQALMEAFTPETGMRLSKSIDVMLDTREEQGRILCAKLSDVTRMGERQTPILPMVRLQVGKVELSGSYVLADVPVILTDAETMLLSLLLGKAKALRVSIADGVAEIRDVQANVQLDGLEAATVSLSLTTVSSDYTPDGLASVIAEELVSLLERLSRAGCDVLGLGRKVVTRTSEMAQWHELAWPQHLRQLRWTVSVQVSGPA